MVKRNGLVPIARARVQAPQQAHRIGDIRCRVEAGFQTGKSIRVMQQIDLHAANINRTHAPRLNRAHFLKRFGVRSGVAAIAGSVIGPGPGLHTAIRRAASRFNLSDGAEQARRHSCTALCRRNCRAAKAPGFRQGGWCWTCGSIGGGGALLARGIGRGGGIRCRQCNMRESCQR